MLEADIIFHLSTTGSAPSSRGSRSGRLGTRYVTCGARAPEVQPRLRGTATLLRYGDDFLLGFEREDEARRVLTVLEKRLGRCGLHRPPDKTRLLPCGVHHRANQRGTGPAPCDFVGFTCSWARSRKGRWGMGCKTKRASLRRAKQAPLRLVSSPSAPTGQGTARRAQSTRARPRQLLRRQRQRSASAAARRSSGEAGVGQMAVPSQPAHALDVGEVWRRAPAAPSPPAHG